MNAAPDEDEVTQAINRVIADIGDDQETQADLAFVRAAAQHSLAQVEWS
jgi:hypothetical protein